LTHEEILAARNKEERAYKYGKDLIKKYIK